MPLDLRFSCESLSAVRWRSGTHSRRAKSNFYRQLVEDHGRAEPLHILSWLHDDRPYAAAVEG